MIDYRWELERRIEISIVGDNAMLCCPFHNDKNPSCGVSLHTGVFNCFSCEVKGPFYKLIAEMDGVEEYVTKLRYSEGDRPSVIINKIRKEMFGEDKEGLKFIKVDSFHRKFVSVFNTKGETYLRGRGLNLDTIREFDLRWGIEGKWKDRVIMPIYSEKGSLVSFAGRGIYSNARPKVRKFRSSLSTLFGLYNLLGKKQRDRGVIILVEGEFDAMYLQQYGYNAVAIMGTSKLTSIQVLLILKFFKYVLLGYDGDERGRKALKRDYEVLSPFLPTLVVKLPKGKDPNDLGSKEIDSIFGGYKW